MLVKDPSQRISIPGIMRHAWFQRSMPPGLLSSQADPSKARQVRGAGQQQEGQSSCLPAAVAGGSCQLACWQVARWHARAMT